MNEMAPTRSALLQAARTLFAEKGYDATSIRAVTSLAGANLGAVTYHFKSKQRLYEAVLDSVTGPLVERVRGEVARAATPLDGIAAGVETLLAYAAENPDWPRLVLRELAFDRPLPPPIRRTIEALAAIVSDRIRAGQADGSIVDGDPLLLTLTVVSQPMYLVIARRRLGQVFPVGSGDAASRPEVVAHVVQAVRRALTPSRRRS